MKKLFIFVLISISCTTFSWSWNPPDQSLSLTSNNRIVQISTTNTSPTLLLTKQAATRTMIYTTSMTFISPITLSVSTVVVSTGTNFIIPGSTLPVFFSPDGIDSPWAGTLYAVINGTTPFTVSVFQAR